LPSIALIVFSFNVHVNHYENIGKKESIWNIKISNKLTFKNIRFQMTEKKCKTFLKKEEKL
jgi:hypothetical protein